jgi:Domain of unknown function (DUF4780)
MENKKDQMESSAGEQSSKIVYSFVGQGMNHAEKAMDHETVPENELINEHPPAKQAMTSAENVVTHEPVSISLVDNILNISDEMSKMTFKRRRLSGAQRKQRAKLRAQQATIEAGGEPSGINSETEKGTDEPCSSNSMPQGGTAAKRQREGGETPAKDKKPAKKAKNMPKPVKTYSEVVRDSLRVAIQNESNLSEGLTHAQAETLKDNLMEALDNIPGSSTTPRPCFHDSSLVHGALMLTCADATSLEWLRSAVTEINARGGPTLVLKTKDELPQYHRASIWIPGRFAEDKVVLSRIMAQNPGLATSCWRVYHSGRASEKGRTIIIGIDSKSVETINGLRGFIFYGLQKVLVNLKQKKAALRNDLH